MPTGRYLRSNSAYRMIVGQSEQELGRMFLGSTIHPDDPGEVRAAIEPIRSGSIAVHETRCRLITEGGREKWIEQLLSPLPGSAGGPLRLAVFARDITERLEVESRLRDADRLAAVGILGAGLAHDMGNLLFTFRSSLTGLRHALPDAEPGSVARDSVELLANGIEHVERLSDGLRLLALPAAGSSDAGAATDVAAWWARSATLLGRALPRAVVLTGVIEPGLPPAAIEQGVLMQVVLNLVVNAGQSYATVRPAAGTRPTVCVTVACGDVPGTMVPVVHDDGAGMRPEVARRAFEPFFTTRRGTHGTGLGLALVKRLVADAGGQIALETAPGAGTTVTVRLACAASASLRHGVG